MMFFQFVGIQFFSIMYLTLILIVFYSKKRYSSAENGIFKVLLIFTLMELFIDICVNYTIKYADLFPLFNEVLCKISLMGYLMWVGALMIYVLLLGSRKKYSSLKDLFKNNNIFAYGIVAMMMVASIIIFLPFDYIYDSRYGISYVRGMCSLYSYFIVIIYLLVILVSNFINRKRIPFSKRLPIFIFIISSAIFLPIQKFNEDVPVLTVPLMSLAIMIMYFTLENPDLKLIEELSSMKSKAEESSEIKNKFIENISYNTIIPVKNIIDDSNELLAGSIDDKSKEKVLDITNNAFRAREMILNTIDMSKIETNSIIINNIDYNLSELIKELCKNSMVSIKENVKFDLNVAEDLPCNLNGDREKVFKVLSNILGNAIKYTEVGKITFDVNGTINNEYVNLIFKITDTGCGIKDEDKPKIFEKFSMLDSHEKNVSGTGLGLAISKKIIELMGGNIELKTMYGAGTTFTIKIAQKVTNYDRIGKVDF